VDREEITAEDKSTGYYAEKPDIKDTSLQNGDSSDAGTLGVPSGWSKVAVHVHTVFSNDGLFGVRTLMQSTAAAGFKGIVFNDHNNDVTLTEYNQRATDISNCSDVAIVADDSYELTASPVTIHESHGIAIGYTSFNSSVLSETSHMSQAASIGALAGPAHPRSAYTWQTYDPDDITLKVTELGHLGVYNSSNIAAWDEDMLQGE
jgi:hypothetical protein